MTQAHINAGKPGSAGACAVAAAVGGAVGVAVVAEEAARRLSHERKPAPVTLHEGRVYSYGRDLGELPPEASDWVDRFDSGGKVEPFEFELR